MAKALVPALAAVVFGTSCAPHLTNVTSDPRNTTAATAMGKVPESFPGNFAIMVGAGDIAYDGPGAEATARLLDNIPGTVFTLGDNAYQNGSLGEYQKYYHPSWGRHLKRTRPVVGNHEYRTPGAAGYFQYYGDRAGDPSKGYYSFDVSPDWHVVAINSSQEGRDAAATDLGPNSEQYRWLERDLDANVGKNVIAMWHHPRFSSGAHGDNDELDAIWRLLYLKGVDIALWGHDHHYERFHAMDGRGKREDLNGVRAFVVGTGGKNHYPFFKLPKRTTAVRNSKTFGVLKLTLYKQGYEWDFVPEAGKDFTDRGRSLVH